ncbi:hypothetical protein [Crassaminicella profunda]|uniref:hypothetical protein n=1 Tax=Crassaminicella profunda TaxID=1286698 RepID=UPI001CA64CEC|nr:hypothetical protein [Crassaminicella profunda]QZY56486.1 hypothetical protein K7H06_06050 [Crassaminicella profunda]
MSYKYRALVIDDEIQIKSVCDTYAQYLKELHDIDIKFDIANNESEYDETKPYDILLVDYNLKKSFNFANKNTGDGFIEKFRTKNRVSKVIFYSSSFVYNQDKGKYTFPFEGKEAFDLINKLQIDRIVPKDNFDMMIEVIESCCKQMDILPLTLTKLLKEYRSEDIHINYTNKAGEEIEITDLINELLNDTEEGRNFRERILKTVFSVLLNVNY